jgi:hypothetical protein
MILAIMFLSRKGSSRNKFRFIFETNIEPEKTISFLQLSSQISSQIAFHFLISKVEKQNLILVMKVSEENKLKFMKYPRIKGLISKIANKKTSK